MIIGDAEWAVWVHTLRCQYCRRDRAEFLAKSREAHARAVALATAKGESEVVATLERWRRGFLAEHMAAEEGGP